MPEQKNLPNWLQPSLAGDLSSSGVVLGFHLRGTGCSLAFNRFGMAVEPKNQILRSQTLGLFAYAGQ